MNHRIISCFAALLLHFTATVNAEENKPTRFFESNTPSKMWNISGLDSGNQIACGISGSWENGAILTVIQDIGDGEVYFDLQWKGNGNFFPNLDENIMKFQFFNFKKHTEKLNSFTYTMSKNQTALVRGVFPEFYSSLSDHEWVRIMVDNTVTHIDLALGDIELGLKEVGKCVKAAKKYKKKSEIDG